MDKTGRPILPLRVVLKNQDLADRAPDSTKRNEGRPHTWKPPLITNEEYQAENPYNKN